MSVCVLVPAFNEAGTIADVVQGARACDGVGTVVVIDDGSSDETATRAAAAGAEVLRHETNRGKGHAVRTGLAHALTHTPTRTSRASGTPAEAAAGDDDDDVGRCA